MEQNKGNKLFIEVFSDINARVKQGLLLSEQLNQNLKQNPMKRFALNSFLFFLQYLFFILALLFVVWTFLAHKIVPFYLLHEFTQNEKVKEILGIAELNQFSFSVKALLFFAALLLWFIGYLIGKIRKFNHQQQNLRTDVNTLHEHMLASNNDIDLVEKHYNVLKETTEK